MLENLKGKGYGETGENIHYRTQNPDTDSICSAIAYADIKNRVNNGCKYSAKRAGQINEETEYVLKKVWRGGAGNIFRMWEPR